MKKEIKCVHKWVGNGTVVIRVGNTEEIVTVIFCENCGKVKFIYDN